MTDTANLSQGRAGRSPDSFARNGCSVPPATSRQRAVCDESLASRPSSVSRNQCAKLAIDRWGSRRVSHSRPSRGLRTAAGMRSRIRVRDFAQRDNRVVLVREHSPSNSSATIR